MNLRVSTEDFKLIEGDAFDVVPRFQPQLFDAIVTSPPYPNQRFEVAPDDFAAWLQPLLLTLPRVLKPSGSFMLNLGRVFRGGYESDYIEQVLACAQGSGWKRLDTIIWHKPNANPHGGVRLTDAHEIVYWLGLGQGAYRGLDDVRRPYAEGSVARLRRRFVKHATVKGQTGDGGRREPNPNGARPTSVIHAFTGGEKGNPHPTPMPQALADDLVRLSCSRGGLVLDPFFGSGNVGRAALAFGRRCIGIEREPEWAELAQNRVQPVLFEVG